jgi:hypothetical protein
MTPQEIIRAIDDVIEGDKPLEGWDYLVSVKHRDPFTKHWSEICRNVEREFHVPGSHQLIGDAGVERLKLIRAELAASCQS